MKIFKGHFIFLWGLVSASIFLPIKSLAFCPTCVLATGAFLGIFRWLGVDDTIIGLWFGGFVFSASMMLDNLLIRKGKRIKFQLFLILSIFYGFVALSLYKFGSLSSYNKIFGVDKIFFGIIFGSSLILLSPYLNKFLKKQNQGKNFISHQKMTVAIGLLIIFSFIFYLIFK